MQQMRDGQSEEQRANITEVRCIRVSSIRNLESAHQPQIRYKK